MAIVVTFGGPTLTQEHYEQSVERLTNGRKKQLETPSDWPVEGLLVHVAGQTDNGFRVVDVWKSEEAFQNFGGHIMPILQELGVDVVPEVYPAHAFVTS